jgi:hypothetical protein
MNPRTPDEEPLESMFERARAAFVERADLAFDFDAGLADVYGRADAAAARTGRAPRGVPPTADAVAEACRQADRLVSILSLFTSGDGPLVFEHVQSARELVLEFRAEAATAARFDPERLAALLTRALGHLDSATGLAGSPLSEMLRRKLTDLGSPHLDPSVELEALRDAARTGFPRYPDGRGRAGRATRMPSVREGGDERDA